MWSTFHIWKLSSVMTSMKITRSSPIELVTSSVAVAHLYERFLLCFLGNPAIPNNVCDLRKTGLPDFRFHLCMSASLFFVLIELTDDSITTKWLPFICDITVYMPRVSKCYLLINTLTIEEEPVITKRIFTKTS